MPYFYVIVIVLILALSAFYYLLKKVWPAKTRGEYLIEIMKEKDHELYEVMYSVSQETGNTLEAVVFTHYALVKDSESVNDEETACENFLMLVNDIYTNIKKGLLSLELRSSKDLSTISASLSEKKIVHLPKNFSFRGLDQVFESID